jgi:hypothetical protein
MRDHYPRRLHLLSLLHDLSDLYPVRWQHIFLTSGEDLLRSNVRHV